MQNFTDETINNESNLVLPVLAVRGLVFFPGMMLQFDITRKKSVLAASEAISRDRLIFLVSQKSKYSGNLFPPPSLKIWLDV